MRIFLLCFLMSFALGISAQSNKHKQLFDEIAEMSRLTEMFKFEDSLLIHSDKMKSINDSLSKYKVENVILKITLSEILDSAYSKIKPVPEVELQKLKSCISSSSAFSDCFDFYTIEILKLKDKKLKDKLDSLKSNPNASVSQWNYYSVNDLRKASRVMQLQEEFMKRRSNPDAEFEDWGGYSADDLKNAMQYLEEFSNNKYLQRFRIADDALLEVFFKHRSAQNKLLKEKGISYIVR
ncbi:MAG: hypothetical protein KBT22_03900 [Bacteroidales bacterium]|nr:hypothetical protein [Candidatus Scybalocola fimicaballi]